MKKCLLPLLLFGLMALSGLAAEVKTSKSAQTLLFVRTIPTGARVLLDGKLLGSSDDVFHAEPGLRKIAVQLEGYLPIDEMVNIPAGEVTRIELKLTRRAASQTDPRPPEAHAPGAGRKEVSAEELLSLMTPWDELSAPVRGTKVVRLGGSDKGPAEVVVPEPALRYSDQFHAVIEGAIWLYGMAGRPLAAQKADRHRLPGFPPYRYCLVSLSDDLIQARWPGEPDWSSSKPGIQLCPLPGGPKPASTEAGRLSQLKESVRRFSATLTDMGNLREEMSLLPGPIHRYRAPSTGLLDGAVFAFAAHGTNPELLVVVELRGPDLGRATWNYGPARLTAGQLSVRLDGKEVWSAGAAFGTGGRYDTWLYFYRGPERTPSPERR